MSPETKALLDSKRPTEIGQVVTLDWNWGVVVEFYAATINGVSVPCALVQMWNPLNNRLNWYAEATLNQLVTCAGPRELRRVLGEAS